MFMRIVVFLFLAGVALALLSGCAASGKRAFVGTWMLVDGSSPNSVVITDGPKNTVTVQWMGAPETYPATFADGKLTAEENGLTHEAVIEQGQLRWVSAMKGVPDSSTTYALKRK